MQFSITLSTLAAVSSALVLRQAVPEDVGVVLEPSYGCPGSDPVATVDGTYLDGACHDIGEFNSTQTSLTADPSKVQKLTFFADEKCTTVAAVLSNVAGEGVDLADGSCYSAPDGQSFKSITYCEE